MTPLDYLIAQTERRLANLNKERNRIVEDRVKHVLLEFARAALPDAAIAEAAKNQIASGAEDLFGRSRVDGATTRPLRTRGPRTRKASPGSQSRSRSDSKKGKP